MTFYHTAEEKERVILVGVSLEEEEAMERSLAELEELVKTAGALTVAKVIQNREWIHPGSYVGSGKLEEIKELAAATGATGIVCDDELSPAQLKNLQAELALKIMDRTLVILDIFAMRASTSEGKIQVELAQLKYQQNRLMGLGKMLSRQGGGIGTRGSGESKLETDRRLIRRRIGILNHDLKEVKRHREVLRSQRNRSNIPVVAIVGYTNAGKSTLLNKLTHASVLEEDQLFATLDPTTRSYQMASGQEILFTDTVGFIRKLPHHLIDAFKSTLEEAKYADIILHVADLSNPQIEEQLETVYQTLDSLEIKNKPIITAFNKIDAKLLMEDVRDFKSDHSVYISARSGKGIEDLLQVIEKILREDKQELVRLFPYAEAGKLQLIRKYGELLEEEYREDGIFVRAYVPKNQYARLANLKKEKEEW